jgi:predicted nucleotidyltransferase
LREGARANSLPVAAIDDPILRRFRAVLDDIHGDRLERVVLFGSRARGDARASGYDVAVFLRDLTDRPAELDRLADLGTDILNETGEFIHGCLIAPAPTTSARR